MLLLQWQQQGREARPEEGAAVEGACPLQEAVKFFDLVALTAKGGRA